MVVHYLEALNLVTGSPVLGTPSLGVRHVCPVMGHLLETRVVADLDAEARRQTTHAREKKGAIAEKKLAALDALARTQRKKNSWRKGSVNGMAEDIAGGMLAALREIDPKRYPPTDPADKAAMDRARKRVVGWIRDSLSKTAVWRERGLPL